MPISNKSSENKMTRTTIRLDPNETKTSQAKLSKNPRQNLDENLPSSTKTFEENPSIERQSPKIFRVKRVAKNEKVNENPIEEKVMENKVVRNVVDQDDDSWIEETKTTTTVIKPIIPANNTTIVNENLGHQNQRQRRISVRKRPRKRLSVSSLSTSTTSSYTSSSTTTTASPRVIRKHTIAEPRPAIEKEIIRDHPMELVPEKRFIRQVPRVRTYSGYYSSDLDHGKRKVYKSDYKYRHFYYCHWFKGRCDLPNSSCSFCEWFYGCPLWASIACCLFILILFVLFFTLLGLQPSINATRRAETAQKKVINRTELIYGFFQNCGVQSGTWTTLILCANTQTTSTSRVILTSSSSRTADCFSSFLPVVFCWIFLRK